MKNVNFKALARIETPHKNLDFEFFEAMGIKVVQHQPWQFSLFYPDLKNAKFVWYPGKTGTLIYETDYATVKVGQFHDSEQVWQEIMKRV